MTYLDFQKKLEVPRGRKLKLTINDNRSTMLSVKWETDCTRVSLHRMFLSAPENIMDELACYISGESKRITPNVTSFIEEGIHSLQATIKIDNRKLDFSGLVHDLKAIYNRLNAEYFDGKLKLNITWFGNVLQQHRTQISFGLYSPPLKLIKIHRKLDSALVPEYVISHIVYHEMLHEVCRTSVDSKGLRRHHTMDFKARESEYKGFKMSVKWIKDNQHLFFK